MVEEGIQEKVFKLFSSGADAVKTYDEISQGLVDKDLQGATLEVST